jgi:ribosomal protein L11 methylase PrmA
MVSRRVAASFRDPSGFLFHGADDTLYRQVNRRFEPNYRLLTDSGLYDELTRAGMLVEHEETAHAPLTEEAHCVIRPRRIPFISYPYEWAFSGLKDAALLTLDIQLRALKRDMQLKDATAYNIQFEGSQPVLIDTLSLEAYKVDAPWQAYGQFCRHFLAPLSLMSKVHIDLGYLLRDFIDGVPLDLASKLLPWRTKLSLNYQLHVHMHAKMIARHAASEIPLDGGCESPKPTGKIRLPKHRLETLLESLRRIIDSLKWNPGGTEWADYYDNTSYSDEGLQQKRNIVEEYLRQLQPGTVWDLGANTGEFSAIASRLGAQTCAFDFDPACVERCYLKCKQEKQAKLLPLRLDLTNPSPSIGWAHDERDSLAARGPADAVMALALIHHLAISNNVTLPSVAEFFHRLGKSLIIEFVPKQDPQVKRLLLSREDIFDQYCQESFEYAFEQFFTIEQARHVGSDGRVLYLMQRR